jgi:hypothetical protein
MAGFGSPLPFLGRTWTSSVFLVGWICKKGISVSQHVRI